jgi:hypothetical protein
MPSEVKFSIKSIIMAMKTVTEHLVTKILFVYIFENCQASMTVTVTIH